MSEQPAEEVISSQQLEEEERSRGDGEGEEKIMQMKADIDDICKEEKNEAQPEAPESPAKADVKQAKVQSVFSLVRSQIRAQTGLESRRTGMLQLVQRVTRQLDRSKGDQNGPVPSLEVTSAEEEVTTAVETHLEVKEDPEPEEKSQDEVCVVLLQEVLDSVASLRKEVREELSLLRLETQSSTEQALKSLELRLTSTLSAHMMPQTLHHRAPLPGALDGKKHKALTVPPLGVTRRRTLSRTLTGITPKTCCPPPGLGPRSMSEPLANRLSERAGSSSSGVHAFMRGSLGPLGPLGQLGPLGPLPPALPPTQHSKKPLRSKARGGKAAP